MDRKGIIAVALAIIVLVIWQVDNSKRMQQQAREKQKAAEAAEAAKALEPTVPPGTLAENPAAPAPGAATGAAPAAPVEPAAPPQVESVDTPWGDFSFVNIGGGIEHVVLKQHKGEGDAPVTMNRF